MQKKCGLLFLGIWSISLLAQAKKLPECYSVLGNLNGVETLVVQHLALVDEQEQVQASYFSGAEHIEQERKGRFQKCQHVQLDPSKHVLKKPSQESLDAKAITYEQAIAMHWFSDIPHQSIIYDFLAKLISGVEVSETHSAVFLQPGMFFWTQNNDDYIKTAKPYLLKRFSDLSWQKITYSY